MSGQAVAAVEHGRRNRERSGPPAATGSMPVPAQERIPMPHRDRLERRFGRPLAGIPVYSGPQVARALADHGAVAATQDGCIFLADRAASLPVVVHEVVHVLQPLLRRPGIPVLEPADSAAEREASRVAAAVTSQAPVSAPSLDEPLPEGSLALLRKSPETTDEQPISLDGGLPVPVPRPAPTPSAAGAMPVPPIPASPPPARAAVGTTPGAAPPAPGPEAATPPPETAALAGLTAEPGAAGLPGAQAQSEQAMAQQAAAQQAMAEATSSGVLLHAYATAPPTAKAAQAATLAAQVGRMADGEAASVQSDVPDLHAHLDAGAPPSGADTVLAPTPHAVELVPPPAGPTPLPQVEVPDAVGEFHPGQDVSAPFNRLTTAEPAVLADQIGESLSDVPVTDPGVPHSTGALPAIPQEGDSDPALLATTQAGAQTQAGTARADAAQAVLDGPGPERVQPAGVDVGYPLGELAVTPLAIPAGPAEAAAADTPQAYLAMNLPPEVQASFDAQQQTAMEQSAAGAADQVDQAAAARDEAKQAAVSDAQTGLAELNGTAGDQQAQAVTDARQGIQAARRDTLDKQQQEVDRVATDAETQRVSQEQEIGARVAQDQQAIESEYNQAQSSIDTKVAEGEQKAAQEKAAAEKAAEEESWWDRAVDFVKDALNALVDAIGAVFDAIRDAVNAILDAVKAAALAIIDAAASFVKGAIAAFAAVLKAAVEGLLGEIFPELAKALTDAIDAAAEAATKAVDAVADTLKAGVNALVESLRAGLMAVINAYQSAITLAAGLVTAAITGDWALLARKVLEAVLRLVGVAPESFYAFVGRAQETWQIIIDAPGAFLGHVVDAVTGGVQRFADHFGTHLQAGIIGWLTGALGSAGITLPQTFDLMGVLDLARQILGLTWDALRAKAVKLIGEQNVQRLQLVYDFIKTLVTEGWAALWNKIMDAVATLKDVVFDAIKSYLVEKVIVAAVTKLVSLFSPVGAIVQLVLTAWNLYTFLRDQLSRIAEVVSTVVTAIGDVARGVLDGAITAVEGVLARLLPIAIDLLARLLGLGNVAEKVREIIENIRATVDRAIDAIIENVANAFRGGSGASGAATSAAPTTTTGAAPGAPVAGAPQAEPGAGLPATPDAVAKSPTVRQDATAEAARRLEAAQLSDPAQIAAIVNAVFTAFQPRGLTSLRFDVTDETTLDSRLVATASEPAQRIIRWVEIFGVGDPARATFQVQPRNETNAAIALDAKRFGEVVASGAGRHAEQNLLNAYWAPVLAAAKARADADPKATPTIAVAINRAPCHMICTPTLVNALRDVDPVLKTRIHFILAPTGIYEPTERLTPEAVKAQEEELRELAHRLGRAETAVIREQLNKVVLTDDTTTGSDLTELIAAGWELFQLKAKSKQTKSGQILAEAAHKATVAADEAKAGKA